jgi:signal recognition particle GTPase
MPRKKSLTKLYQYRNYTTTMLALTRSQRPTGTPEFVAACEACVQSMTKQLEECEKEIAASARRRVTIQSATNARTVISRAGACWSCR